MDYLTFFLGFSFRGFLLFFLCLLFKYSVKLSSVCVLLLSVSVDLLQVPGFTALAYVLA